MAKWNTVGHCGYITPVAHIASLIYREKKPRRGEGVIPIDILEQQTLWLNYIMSLPCFRCARRFYVSFCGCVDTPPLYTTKNVEQYWLSSHASYVTLVFTTGIIMSDSIHSLPLYTLDIAISLAAALFVPASTKPCN